VLILIALGCGGSLSARAAGPPQYSLRWNTNSNPITVEIAGVEKETLGRLQATSFTQENWPKVLSVYAGQDALTNYLDLPPMLGRHQIVDGLICFVPQFPLDRGVPYRAVFRPSNLPGSLDTRARVIVSEIQLPVVQREPVTTVVQVYPSGDELPENLLKFYIHFSAPMRGGDVYAHIHLRDEAGGLVELPFLELDEELWNPEMTRLTLFIDPGRIKREVKPLEDIGPALVAGKRYTLQVDAALRDGAGTPLREDFHKSFRVSPPDREPVSLADWKITPPKSGTRGELSLRFPKPMDHALALRVIGVADAAGRLREGKSTMADHEMRWVFTPLKTWTAGTYQLQVRNIIEDLAGNNPGKAFEEDLVQGAPKPFTNQVVTLSFEVH
jgi:hypothetical protein